MKIADIYQFQHDKIKEINAMAKLIHPKLLSKLSYRDLFNDELANDSFQERFNQSVKPIIDSYIDTNTRMCEDYLLEFVHDMGNLFESIGYDLDDGTVLTGGDVSRKLFVRNYFPSVEIAHVWDEVMTSLMYAYRPVPYWSSPTYWVTGSNEKAGVSPSSSPSEYIRKARGQFGNQYGLKVLEDLERCVDLKRTLDYNILVEPLTVQEERNIPSNFTDAIHRHLVLKHVLENVQDMDKMEDINWDATITAGGVVTLTNSQGKTL